MHLLTHDEVGFASSMDLTAHFVHINKTGGSSIENALGIKFQHKTASEQISEIGLEAWKSRFTFSFVRNPWDRVVSHYHWRVKTNQTGLGLSPIPFNDWVKFSYGENNPKYYDKPKMFMPQIKWITEDNSTNRAKIAVNFIGRFEKLHTDFGTICSMLSLKTQPDLPHLKPSNRTQDYTQYYNTRSRDIIGEWFAKDVLIFDYKFGE